MEIMIKIILTTIMIIVFNCFQMSWWICTKKKVAVYQGHVHFRKEVLKSWQFVR